MRKSLAVVASIATAVILGNSEGGAPSAGAENPSTLCIAAAQGHTELVELLLRQGADVNAFTRPDPATGIVTMTPLMAAAMNGHADVVELLLRHGADLSAETGETALYPAGVTALYLAAVKGHDNVVAVLDAAGTAGEPWWKYFVILIWIALGLMLAPWQRHARSR